MPKRSNQFQRLIYLVKKALSEGAVVEESQMLTDRRTGAQRETDICITGMVGDNAVMVCAECCDKTRKADVNWVGQQVAKHQYLPTNALILAARGGFTKEAKRVAQLSNAVTVSLEQDDLAALPKLLAESSSLWLKTAEFTVERVVVRVIAKGEMEAENVAVSPGQDLFDADGLSLGFIAESIRKIMQSDILPKKTMGDATADHSYFVLRWEAPRTTAGKPLCLQKIEPRVLREIESIEIRGPCKFVIQEFGLQKGRLGEVHIAWGGVEFFGKQSTVLATRDSKGVERITVDIQDLAAKKARKVRATKPCR